MAVETHYISRITTSLFNRLIFSIGKTYAF
nr:MAG TPA: hypothetical protein [Caudoviricetes sp.]